MEDWKIRANERIKKDNAKKKQLRSRLSASCVKSIDDCIQAAESIHDSLVNTVAEGYLSVNLHEIVHLQNAVRALRWNICLEQEIE